MINILSVFETHFGFQIFSRTGTTLKSDGSDDQYFAKHLCGVCWICTNIFTVYVLQAHHKQNRLDMVQKLSLEQVLELDTVAGRKPKHCRTEQEKEIAESKQQVIQDIVEMGDTKGAHAFKLG